MSDPAEDRSPPRQLPFATIALAAAMLVVFAFEVFLGLYDMPFVALYRAGAIEHGAVFEGGEVWRLLSAAFCHVGIIHLLVNGWALIQLGPFMEAIYGKHRLLVVFLLSAIACSLASAGFGSHISAGASGGLMGIVGFLIAARFLHAPEVRTFLREVIGNQLIFWAGVTLALGLIPAIPIDQLGHVGGLACGLVLAAVVRGTGREGRTLRVASALLVAAAIASLGAAALLGGRSATIERAAENAQSIFADDRSPEAARRGIELALSAPGATHGRIVGAREDRALDFVDAAIVCSRTEDALAFALAPGTSPRPGATPCSRAPSSLRATRKAGAWSSPVFTRARGPRIARASRPTSTARAGRTSRFSSSRRRSARSPGTRCS